MPPRTSRGLDWIASHPEYLAWRQTTNDTLHLKGTDRLQLSDIASYLSRYVADQGAFTLIARFSFEARMPRGQMLAAIIYQVLCQRPKRFRQIVENDKLLRSLDTRKLDEILRKFIASMLDHRENAVVVLDAVDRVPEGRHSGRCGFSALQEIQRSYPLRLIVTSKRDANGLFSDSMKREIDVDSEMNKPTSDEDWPHAPDICLRGGSGISPRIEDDSSDQYPSSESSRGIRNEDGSTALHVACETGDLTIVRQMLDDGANVRSKDKDGSTPLHIASKYGYTNLIQELLKRGSDPMASNYEGSTALHVACNASCGAGVELLLSSLQSKFPVDRRLRTPLHMAIASGDIRTFRHVLDHYLDYWGRSMASVWPVALEELLLREDQDGRNALHTAAQNGNVDCIEEILLRATAHDAVWDGQCGSSLKLKDLLFKGRDLQGRSPLHLAVEKGHNGAVWLLCEEATGTRLISSADSAGQTPLHLACLKGNSTIVTDLLRFGAPINAVDQNKDNPVLLAAANGQRDVFRLLASNGASLLPVEAGRGPLHEAATLGNEQMALEVLQLPVSDNDGFHISLKRTVDQRGRFPAMLAAKHGNEALFNLLLADDNQLAIMDLDQRSVLHYAVEGGNQRLVRSIARRSWMTSHITTVDSFGYTPLRLAAKLGHTEAIDTLLRYGALPTADKASSSAATDQIGLQLLQLSAGFLEDSELAEAFHNAAQRGHLGTVKTLISEYFPDRLDPDCTDLRGKTALILAAEAGQLEVLKLLITEVSEIVIDRADDAQRTAFSYAAGNGHIGVVELLAKYIEVNVDSEDAQQRSPIYFAATNGHLEVVKTLVASTRSRSQGRPKLFAPMCSAAEAGHVEIVWFLLQKGADPSKVDPAERLNVFERALREGHASLVGLLLRHVTENTARDGQPFLHLAWKHPDVIKGLLRKVNVDATGRNNVTALGLAIHKGYMDSVLALLAGGASILHRDTDGRTPLHYAATVKKSKKNTPDQKTILHGELLEILLLHLGPSESADIADNYGNTPLSDAVAAGAIYSVRALLERGDSDIGRRTRGGRSALWIAIEKNRHEVVNLMLEMAPWPAPTSLQRESARDLIVLAAQHKPDLQVILLDRLPDIDLRDPWVSRLVGNDTTGKVVKFLVDQGVNSLESDQHGWSMMDFVYATDKVFCSNKSDEEITRTSNQHYRHPDRWIPLATAEQLPARRRFADPEASTC